MSDFYPGITVTELIPGDPEMLLQLADRLGTLGAGLGDTTTELEAIYSGQWVGRAAEAFRHAVQQQPGKYESAASAFGSASRIIGSYAESLSQAQRVAQLAIEEYEQAGPPPDTRQAEATLAQARYELVSAASATAQRLREAEEGAPSRPGVFGQIVGETEELAGKAFHLDIQFIEGVWDGVTGMVGGIFDIAKVGWEFSPYRFLIDPRGWVRSVDSAEKTIAVIGDCAFHHPAAFAEKFGANLIDLNQWEHDPAKALGELVPTIALAAFTAGVGIGADGVADGAEVTADTAASTGDDLATASEGVDSVGANIAGDSAVTHGSPSYESLKAGINAVSNAETVEGVGQAADDTPNHDLDGEAAGYATDKLVEVLKP